MTYNNITGSTSPYPVPNYQRVKKQLTRTWFDIGVSSIILFTTRSAMLPSGNKSKTFTCPRLIKTNYNHKNIRQERETIFISRSLFKM